MKLQIGWYWSYFRFKVRDLRLRYNRHPPATLIHACAQFSRINIHEIFFSKPFEVIPEVSSRQHHCTIYIINIERLRKLPGVIFVPTKDLAAINAR